MIDPLDGKTAIYALARLIDEQEKQIQTLQAMVGALLWMATRGDADKMREFAAKKWLIVRSSFGDNTSIRYLPDILLEPGYERLHAYFNIYSRNEVQRFLEDHGFSVAWHPDRRQTEKFNGKPESVGGIELSYEFLVAERVRPFVDVDQLDDHFAHALTAWREHATGGPSA